MPLRDELDEMVPEIDDLLLLPLREPRIDPERESDGVCCWWDVQRKKVQEFQKKIESLKLLEYVDESLPWQRGRGRGFVD